MGYPHGDWSTTIPVSCLELKRSPPQSWWDWQHTGGHAGGMLLGTIESIGPAALGVDFQLKDVVIAVFHPGVGSDRSSIWYFWRKAVRGKIMNITSFEKGDLHRGDFRGCHCRDVPDWLYCGGSRTV